MLIKLVLIALVAYFALWVYTFALVVRFQNAFHRRFSEESKRFLASSRVLGINTKSGLLFLWDDGVKELSRNDKDIERFRKRTVRSVIILMIIIAISPILLISTFFIAKL